MTENIEPTRWPSSHEVDRLARAERNRALRAFGRDVLHKLSAMLRATTFAVARAIRKLAAAERRRGAMRALQELDDRTLADIGVPRSEIEYAVRGLRLRLVHREPTRSAAPGQTLLSRQAA